MKRKVTKTCGTSGVAMITIALCLNGLKFLGARLLNWFSLARTQLLQWTRSGGQYKARLTNSTKLPRRQHQAGIPRCPPDSGKKKSRINQHSGNASGQKMSKYSRIATACKTKERLDFPLCWPCPNTCPGAQPTCGVGF